MMTHGAQGFHPGMPQHVHPGHPMAPGMAHNPSQPGAQPGMPPQMAGHMVSGPGAQVNPAAFMGGMPPGNAQTHALQHLNPQVFQQQQQQLAMAQAQAQSNPALLQQFQQQRFLQHQQAQQRQAMMANAAMYGGMGANGMPMGGQMGQMNAAQFAAIRNANAMGRVGLPPHLQQAQAQLAQQGQHQPVNPQQAQQLLAQQLAMQQQHQAAANQAQHGNMPGHPTQLTPQQHMQLAQQQQQAQQQQAQQQQHAQIAASMGQVQPPVPAQAPGQQAQPQQPQGPGQPGQPQPQPQQAGQQPQPTTQPPQQVPTPAGGQPAGPPNQPQNANQPNQPGPQGPGQAGQAQPQGANQPPQPNPQMAQAAQQQQQQQQQLANMQQLQLQHQAQLQLQQQRSEGMKGQCVLKLLQFGEHLSAFPGCRDDEDTSYWIGFAHEFFSGKGAFRMMVNIEGASESERADKSYEISFHALPRFFHTVFQSGVQRMQLVIDQGTVDKPLPGGAHYIENSKASLLYWYSNSLVVGTGSLKAFFDREQKLDLLEFVTTGHEEYITRKLAISAMRPMHMWTKEWHKLNSDAKQSPEMSKKGKLKQMKSPPNPPPELDLPKSTIKPLMGGITHDTFQLLEINEVLGQMIPLFNYYRENPGLGAYDALNQYVALNVNQSLENQQVMMNGQPGGPVGMMPGGPRTPSFGQFPMGASPAAAHLQLPGSPHIGSPAPGHMQAPGMALQQSQQGTAGTGSTGPSANTSPASNKRRRPSGVKTEDDSGAPTPASMSGAVGGPGPGQVNGVQGAMGKKPPTPRMGKRLKVNPPAS